MPTVQLGSPVPLFPGATVRRRPNEAPDRTVDPAGSTATASVLETPRGGFFYPRIVYGGGAQVDFTTPANPLISEARIKGENISLAGYQETLSVRLEPRLTLGFTILSRDNLAQIRAWWVDWASLGRQSAIVLDRFNTCTGQYEFDLFNTTFDKAHCLYNPFEPHRFVVSRQLFTLQLLFRQGQVEG